MLYCSTVNICQILPFFFLRERTSFSPFFSFLLFFPLSFFFLSFFLFSITEIKALSCIEKHTANRHPSVPVLFYSDYRKKSRVSKRRHPSNDVFSLMLTDLPQLNPISHCHSHQKFSALQHLMYFGQCTAPSPYFS